MYFFWALLGVSLKGSINKCSEFWRFNFYNFLKMQRLVKITNLNTFCRGWRLFLFVWAIVVDRHDYKWVSLIFFSWGIEFLSLLFKILFHRQDNSWPNVSFCSIVGCSWLDNIHIFTRDGFPGVMMQTRLPVVLFLSGFLVIFSMWESSMPLCLAEKFKLKCPSQMVVWPLREEKVTFQPS